MTKFRIQVRGYMKPWRDTDRVFDDAMTAQQAVDQLMNQGGGRRVAIYRAVEIPDDRHLLDGVPEGFKTGVIIP